MEKIILAAASFYIKSYYYNFEEFISMPIAVQNELRILLTQTCENTRGIVVFGFYSDGSVFLESIGDESDLNYDEIGAKYHINLVVKKEEEFFKSLSIWFLTTMTKEGRKIKDEFMHFDEN